MTESLDAYLEPLNDVGEALASFERLADRVLACESPPVSLASPSASACASASASVHPAYRFSPVLSQASPGSPASSSSRSSATSNSSLGLSSTSGDQRQKNARAAKRYRSKVRGHSGGLQSELEREQTRNEHLKRELKAKLALYGELVALLARNTRSQADADLAQMGARSLNSVLGDPSEPILADSNPEAELELRCQLAYFSSIIRQPVN